MNPENPSVLYAAGWNRIRTSLESIAEGDDAIIFKTTDGGETWEELNNGLPEGPMSRIGLHLWEGDPSVLFALYVNPSYQLEGVYKSQDAGESFETIPTFDIPENALGGFGWYFGKLGVNPTNQEEISVLGIDLYSTVNGGNNWVMSAPPWFEYTVHADKHDMVYLGPQDILLATDGGLFRTTDGAASWQDVDQIPNTQFYRIATSPHDLSLIYGGAQDNGTSISTGEEPTDDWIRFFGGDGFQPIVDPIFENLTYVTVQNGIFYSIDTDFGEFLFLNNGYPPEERVNWDAPLRMDHNDNSVLYMARERVYKMEDAPFGFWEPISPVLVEDTDLFFSRRNVSTIDQSKVNGEVFYAGTSDGKAWVSQNGGDSWADISDGLPGFYVTDVKASPFDEAEVLISVSGYRNNDETPHLYLSSDYGQNWIPVSGNLDEMPVNHIEIYDETTWFIASDNGVYMTVDNGLNWYRSGANFPFVVVTDLEIQTETNRLIAGTFGVSTFSADIAELVGDVVSTTQPEKAMSVGLYPNPAQNFISVSDIPLGATYDVLDMNGRSVLKGVLANQRIELNLSSGVYLINLEKDGVLYRNKFIVSDF
ncbi:MAG TPA: T9SS type A sorting domain-containing protein, partial [Cryomorphaceae bacterium]|nr:T9SS type A sorting domain-containing protein [Cryomorphaceae bacterium]